MAELSDNDSMFIERFLSAFKNIGGNEHGFIDYNIFKNLLEKNNVAEEKKILNLINGEQHVRDGKLDYISLCFSVLTFKTVFNSLSSENGKVLPPSPRTNTLPFKKNKGANNGHQKETSRVTSETPFIKSLKGMLFIRDRDLLGYRYQLELLENSAIEIFVNAVDISDSGKRIPLEVLIFQDSAKKIFITSSSVINDDGFCSVKCTLKKGKYILIPILLKWNHISDDLLQNDGLNALMEINEESSMVFTPEIENALREVFDAVDIDGNGLLNQMEFDFFIRLTSGESAAEEWTTVEDNFKTANGQLTFEGFLELYRLILQTDPPDMLNMFQKMGMNNKFELSYAQKFIIEVRSETAKCSLSPLPVSSYLEVAEKVVKKNAIEYGTSSKVKNMNDLFLFKHHLPHRITYVVQNQSHSKTTVRLDCSDSMNCESHRGQLDYSVEILPRTSMIVHHIFPQDVTKDWNVECKDCFKIT